MAKGANDLILRDRLQFDITSQGGTILVYGRVDMSDYVSIPEAKGLAIKEIRFQLRTRNDGDNGVWPDFMGPELIASMAPDATYKSSVKLFATTTAYESVVDVGIASPNVICVFDKQSLLIRDTTNNSTVVNTYEHMFGTPDLHPEGYDIVTDLLIGIACNGLTNEALSDTTAEVDVMIIAEPKKITSKDLTQMLSQAQDV